MVLIHKKNLLPAALIALGLAACGTDGAPEGTVFEPPAWVLALGNGGLSGTVTGSTGGAGSGTGGTFHGVRANIADVAEPLIVAEANSVETETQLTKLLTANGVADDGETILTLQWTVLQGVSPPLTMDLVVTPPLDTGEANFVYSETLTTGVPNAITAVAAGQLTLDKWNDIQVRGTFSATVVLADDTVRTISDGIIDVRF